MVAFLYICGVLSFVWSFMSFGGGTVMVQIYSGTIATAGAVFVVGGAILNALNENADRVITETRKTHADPSPVDPPMAGRDGELIAVCKCGTEYPANLRRCPSCGNSLPV